MQIHFNKQVMTNGLVIPSGNKFSTSSSIDSVVANKLLINTRFKILYLPLPPMAIDIIKTVEEKMFLPFIV